METAGICVKTEVHSPSVVSPGENLDLRSGSEGLSVSVRESGALRVRSDPFDRTVSLDTGPNALTIDSSEALFRSTELRASASKKVAFRTGNSATSSVQVGLVGSGVTGTGDGFTGSYFRTAADGAGSDLVISNDGDPGREVALNLRRTGKIDCRAGREVSFAVDGGEVLTLGQDAVTVRTDLVVSGAVNHVSGSVSSLYVQDPVVRVGVGRDGDSDLASSQSGLQIQSVPSEEGDLQYLGKYTGQDGARAFVRDDGTGAGPYIDFESAVSAGIFTKTFAHEIGGGARVSGLHTTASRAKEPRWVVSGGGIRLSRYIPSESAPGVIRHYVMSMRVTDTGSFEVGKTTTLLTHRPGTTSFVAHPARHTVMQRVEN